MADLRGREIRESYKYLLSLEAVTSSRATGNHPAINTSAKFVTDGTGTRSVLRLGTDSAQIEGQLTVAGNMVVLGTLTSLNTSESTSIEGQFLGTDTDSATQPSFSWVANTNTGFYQPEINLIGVSINGNERLLISTSALSIINTQPTLRLVNTNNITEMVKTSTEFKISTVNLNNSLISDDYIIQTSNLGSTSHSFNILNTTVARIDGGGASAEYDETIMTREKSDARYIRTSENTAIPVPLTLSRVDNISSGGRLVLNRSLDNSLGVGVDSFGNSNNPSLRFFDSSGDRAYLESRSSLLDNNISIVTREKGDLRYARIENLPDFSTFLTREEADSLYQPVSGNTTEPEPEPEPTNIEFDKFIVYRYSGTFRQPTNTSSSVSPIGIIVVGNGGERFSSNIGGTPGGLAASIDYVRTGSIINITIATNTDRNDFVRDVTEVNFFNSDNEERTILSRPGGHTSETEIQTNLRIGEGGNFFNGKMNYTNWNTILRSFASNGLENNSTIFRSMLFQYIDTITNQAVGSDLYYPERNDLLPGYAAGLFSSPASPGVGAVVIFYKGTNRGPNNELDPEVN